MRVENLIRLRCALGEGLYWDASSGCLIGVDIEGQYIWKYSLTTKELQKFATTSKVGWCIRAGSNFLTGQQHGIILVDLASGGSEVSKVGESTLIQDARYNDAKADITGAIWGGVMYENHAEDLNGYLFRLGTNGSCSIKDDGYGIPNGPAISPDGLMMLHTDSASRVIYAFDFNAQLGEIKGKRVWKKFSSEDGTPDGMCFDRDGFLWVAAWGGASVSRLDYDGNQVAKVKLPTSNISNVCFGGEFNDRLFVSSARPGPCGGDIFEILDHGTTGLLQCQANIQFT